MQISKELLEALVGYEIERIQFEHDEIIFVPKNKDNTGRGGCLWSRYDNGDPFNYIKHNDLFFKCKKWAVDRGVTISTYPYYFDDGFGANWNLTKLKPKDFYEQCGSWKGNNSGGAVSEHQAVVDACEWILKQGICYASK